MFPLNPIPLGPDNHRTSQSTWLDAQVQASDPIASSSSDDQQGAPAASPPTGEVRNLLIDSLLEAAPEAAAAGAAALKMLKASQQQQDIQAAQQSFLEEYHWHSGAPLEPAIWTATEQTAIILSHFQTSSKLLACPILRFKHKARISTALKQCADRKLVASRAEADKHLAKVCHDAIECLKEYPSRQEAMNSRALHLYASSLSNTSFINRNSSATLQPVAGQKQLKQPLKVSKNLKAPTAKGGAGRIKEENRLRQVAKQQVLTYL